MKMKNKRRRRMRKKTYKSVLTDNYVGSTRSLKNSFQASVRAFTDHIL